MEKVLHRRRYMLAAFLVVLFPLTLLLDPKNTFYHDWHNHLWAVSYYSAFFSAHSALPVVIHTHEIVGLVFPIFYAHWFYVAGGVLGSVFGPDLSIRLLVLALMSMQFFCVFNLFRTYSRNGSFAAMMAVFVTWSIYPMTTLYNRAALTEFAAVCLLNASICSLLGALALTDRRIQARTIVGAGLLFTLSALVHPITGAIGGVFLSVLFLIVIACERVERHLLGALVGAGVLSLIVLSPWLYALFHFAADLPVNETGKLITEEFDTVLSRIAPFPLDTRSLVHGRQVETPYLDAQLNVAIVAFLITLLLAFGDFGTSRNVNGTGVPIFRIRVTSSLFTAVLMWSSLLAFAYLFAVSIGFDFGLVPSLLSKAQYAYRLVTYLNLCLLFMTLAATQYLAGLPSRNAVMVAGVAIAVFISFSGTILKLAHANVVRHGQGPWRIMEQRLNLPETLYSLGDYNIRRDVNVSPEAGSEVAAFNPSSGAHFGELQSIEIQVDTESAVNSNVYLFPWNKILVDGRHTLQRGYSSRAYSRTRETFLTSVVLPPGRHVLEYRFEPDRAWIVLRHVSAAVLLLWVTVMCGWILRRRSRR